MSRRFYEFNITNILGAIFILLILVVGLFVYSNKKSQERYNQDLESLYKLATKLGYKQENHLNFFHNYHSSISAHYDVLELLFITDESIEPFSERVSNLGFRERLKSKSPQGFLYKSFDRLKEKLSIIHNSPREFLSVVEEPHVTQWLLIEPGDKLVTIYYAHTNSSEDNWVYDNKILKGNIVELHMKR